MIAEVRETQVNMTINICPFLSFHFTSDGIKRSIYLCDLCNILLDFCIFITTLCNRPVETEPRGFFPFTQ